jgi:hypothetical protein
MAISAAMEERMSAAVQRRNAQDKRWPMLINIDDGRLVPNVPRLGGKKAVKDANGRTIEPAIPPHPKYRVWRGDSKAPIAERLRILREGLSIETAPVIDAAFVASAEAAFDISTADANELVAFANEQYGTKLNANTPLHLLRGKVKALALKHGDAAPPAAGISAALAPAGEEPDDSLS